MNLDLIVKEVDVWLFSPLEWKFGKGQSCARVRSDGSLERAKLQRVVAVRKMFRIEGKKKVQETV